MMLPLTPVVGYFRADTPGEAERLREGLDAYAQRAGLVVCRMFEESAGATGATLPAFDGCLDAIRADTARGILLPTWAHLSPNPILGTALLRAAGREAAELFVADRTDVPDWASVAAASTHQTLTEMQAAWGRP